jgi:ketosteroid isomerase-like protein
MGNRAVVERYTAAIESDDFDGQDALVHDDYQLTFPQSGETFRGRANRRFVYEQYPGREGSGRQPSVSTISGSDDQFIPRPSVFWSVVHLAGSGDEFTVTGTIRYPNEELWYFVSLIDVRDGRIWREIAYWGLPFEPPEWRASVREPA